MAESVVALTYGAALFEAAQELGREDEFLQELDTLKAVLEDVPGFEEFLRSPAITGEEKKKVISTTLEGKLSREMINFLFVLVDKSRTSQIMRIRHQYIELYDKERGQAYGEIFSADPLTDEQLTRFEQEMSKLLKKNIKLENIVEKELLGGVKIQVDGKMIDKSIKGDFDALLRSLKDN